MTLDEFLDDYVPNTLKPLKGQWRGDGISSIRIEWKDGTMSCPLTAGRKTGTGDYIHEGRLLGLDKLAIDHIVCAADFCCAEGFQVRARLQHGLGLTA